MKFPPAKIFLSKKLFWSLFAAVAVLLLLRWAFVTAAKFNLGETTVSVGASVLSSNSVFADESFIFHIIWDGPTGEFLSGDIFGLKLGGYLIRLDIVKDHSHRTR